MELLHGCSSPPPSTNPSIPPSLHLSADVAPSAVAHPRVSCLSKVWPERLRAAEGKPLDNLIKERLKGDVNLNREKKKKGEKV